jgi:hypothetical protein
MPGVIVIPEPALANPTGWKANRLRLSGSKSSCYAELVVRDLYFLKTALFKPEMRVNFTYRYFGARTEGPAVTEGRGGNNMTVYPLVSTSDLDKIKADFVSTYVDNFHEFVIEQTTKGGIKPPASMTAVPAS